jgi:hypothetical protein
VKWPYACPHTCGSCISRLHGAGQQAGWVRTHLFGKEHCAAGIVQVQERLQVVEIVRGLRLGCGLVGEQVQHFVPDGQVEHELRLQGALDVHVQLRLRQEIAPVWRQPADRVLGLRAFVRCPP